MMIEQIAIKVRRPPCKCCRPAEFNNRKARRFVRRKAKQNLNKVVSEFL